MLFSTTLGDQVKYVSQPLLASASASGRVSVVERGLGWTSQNGCV